MLGYQTNRKNIWSEMSNMWYGLLTVLQINSSNWLGIFSWLKQIEILFFFKYFYILFVSVD